MEQGSVPARGERLMATFTDYEYAHHSMVCSGCSCLCDDVSYYVKDGRVVRTLNLCEVGMKQLRSCTAEDRLLPMSPRSFKECVHESLGLLSAHRPVLILGPDSVDEAAIMASLQMAQALEAMWLPWAFTGMRRFFDQVTQFGWATALLDEVRDQADLVCFWGADPLVTHHRHLSRYSFFARGRYTERGSSDRNLAAVARHTTVIEPLCQQFFVVPSHEDLDLIKVLNNPLHSSGPDHRDVPLLVKALQKASYIAVFVDPENMSDEALCALFEWSASVNNKGHTRFVILPLWAAGANIAGFTQISMECVGTGWGYDFSGGPMIHPSNSTWENLSDKVGSVLMVESGSEGANRTQLPEPLIGKPLVVINPFKEAAVNAADVVIPAALSGIENDGIFYRADGLPMKTRKIRGIIDGGYPSVDEILKGILMEWSSWPR